MSRVIVHQSQEKFKKLTEMSDEIMQSGISLAEDLTELGDVYVDEIKKCMMELAKVSQNVDNMLEAIGEVDNNLKEHSNEEKPPDLAEVFRTRLQSSSKKQYDPSKHPLVIQFMQQNREDSDDSEEEMETQDGDDDDLVLGHVQRSLYCPLTKKFLEDPVTSKTCNHSYSRAAILEHIKKRPTCPVCNAPVKQSDLEKDVRLQRKVRKAKKLEKKKKRASKEGVVKL